MKYLITSGAIAAVVSFGMAAGGCGNGGYEAPPPAPATDPPPQQQQPQQPGTEDDPFGQPSPGAPGTP